MKLYALRGTGARVVQYESRSWVVVTPRKQVVVCTGVNREGRIRSSLRIEPNRDHGARYLGGSTIGAKNAFGVARPRWRTVSTWRGEVRILFGFGSTAMCKFRRFDP